MDKSHMRVSKQNASVKDQVVQQHALVKNRLRERRQQLIDEYNQHVQELQREHSKMSTTNRESKAQIASTNMSTQRDNMSSQRSLQGGSRRILSAKQISLNQRGARNEQNTTTFLNVPQNKDSLYQYSTFAGGEDGVLSASASLVKLHQSGPAYSPMVKHPQRISKNIYCIQSAVPSRRDQSASSFSRKVSISAFEFDKRPGIKEFRRVPSITIESQFTRKTTKRFSKQSPPIQSQRTIKNIEIKKVEQGMEQPRHKRSISNLTERKNVEATLALKTFDEIQRYEILYCQPFLEPKSHHQLRSSKIARSFFSRPIVIQKC